MKYSSIHIINFRAISDLRLENFKQINLITGRNNSGKTTVLEALFQISGMSNPQLPATINNIRDLVLTSDDNFNFIFHNLDFNQEPHLSAIFDGARRDLIIKPKYAQFNTLDIVTNKINQTIEKRTDVNTDNQNIINGIILEFKDGKNNEKFTSEISLSNNRIGIDNRYKERLLCSFHSPQLSMAMFPQRIERLLVNKQMDGIIASLKEIDKNITDIRMGSAGMIYTDIGLDKLLPLNIMGDGIRRILSMLAAVSDMQGGVLLIDEIENGLHYSSLEILWKALLKAAMVYRVQLFVTTHSNDCIKALSAVTEQNSDDVRLYRIERNENMHRAFEYPPEMISVGVENDIEMR
jgi:AAA15 family ATPase/GTPase